MPRQDNMARLPHVYDVQVLHERGISKIVCVTARYGLLGLLSSPFDVCRVNMQPVIEFFVSIILLHFTYS